MSYVNRDPIPERQGAGRRNLDIFLTGSKQTPVCFYFEDEGAEELYLRFIRRLFPGIPSPLVLCSGGKTKREKVLAEADQLGISPIVFVQDKDFDDIIGVLPSDQRVVTLNRYSFENYLLDSDALVELAIESKRRLRREDADKDLSFNEYFSDLYTGYAPLSVLFIVSQRLNLRKIQTTKQSIFKLVPGGVSLVSDQDVALFRAQVLKAAQGAQHVTDDESLQVFLDSALKPRVQYESHSDNHPNTHQCGKHLLDLTLAHIDGKLGTKLSDLDRFEIAMRLLVHLSVNVFDRVRLAIISSLDAQRASPSVLKMMA